MIHATVEVRWFFAGPVPANVQAWFRHRAAEAVTETPRTDTYLLLPKMPKVGIKLREGGLEMKEQTAVFPNVMLCCAAAGVVEGWRKTRFLLADAPNMVHSHLPFGPWLAVTKRRQLQKFTVAEKGVTAVSPDTPASEVCEVELSQVTVEQQTWWSLALEASGTAEQLVRNLQKTAQHVFAVPPPHPLRPADSLSYPAWLGQHFAKDSR